MKKRVSSDEPLFQFLEIDASDVERHGSSIDDILGRRISGLIVHNAIPNNALQAAQKQLAEDAMQAARRPFNGFPDDRSSPFMIGRVLVSADPDLVEYFDTAPQTRKHLRTLFAGTLDIDERVQHLLGALAAQRSVCVPTAPDGRVYASATVRSLPHGHGIGVHADNSSARVPQMHALASIARVNEQLSFFFVLTAPTAGGDLVVYGLEWGDVASRFPDSFNANEILYDKTNSLLPLVELSGSTTIKAREGDLFIFDAGRYFHRVTPVVGSRPRTTLGGFMALSHDERILHPWS